MPLRKQANKRAMQENIRQLIREGYRPAQAVAIAWKVFRQAAGRKGARARRKR